jgi:transcriptional regulator with XRE-family HTH domain
MPTIEQIRAARALLDWSQSDLADNAGLSQTGIARIENGTNKPNSNTLEKIKKAFDDADIEFLGDSGVRRKANEVKTLNGQDGFRRFMDDVYETVKQTGGEISVYNVNEKNWIRWMGEEEYKSHANRMKSLKDTVKFRIIIQENDYYFIANDFAQYKWFPKALFKESSFYAYGGKLALINFEKENVVIMMLDQKDFTDSFRVLFDIAWNHVAKDPTK